MNTQRQTMFSTPSLTLAERHPRLVIALIVAIRLMDFANLSTDSLN